MASRVGGPSNSSLVRTSMSNDCQKKKKSEESDGTPHAMQDLKKADMKRGSLGGGGDSFVSGSK